MKTINKWMMALAAMIIVLPASLLAQQSDEEYRKVIYGRSEKIVATLSIEDEALSKAMVELIATQYIDLGVINDGFAAKQKEIKASGMDKAAQEAALNLAQLQQRNDLSAKHYYFVAQLDANLTPEQVELVKDGMTMGVYPKTYQAHLEMIPTLKEEEKAYIRAALKEAREYAMDCSDSNAKHGWFGKYKGRINNYLSKQGYNLTKEREGWNQRIKEAEAKNK